MTLVAFIKKTMKMQAYLRHHLKQKVPDYIMCPSDIKSTYNDCWTKTDQEPVPIQIKRRKWSWLGHMLRRNDVSIAKQAVQWKPQGHRRRGRPWNTWRRDVESEMGAAGLKYRRWRQQLKTKLDGESGLWSMLHLEWQSISQVKYQ